MSILTIDPGLHACGVAVFDLDVLIHASWPKASLATGGGPAVWCSTAKAVVGASGIYNPSCLVLEMPVVYGPGARKGDPNDLLQLGGVLGAISDAYAYCDFVTYQPRDWKGQVPKPIMQKRIASKLTPKELKLLEGQNHNVWDAVGIGLKYLGRL